MTSGLRTHPYPVATKLDTGNGVLAPVQLPRFNPTYLVLNEIHDVDFFQGWEIGWMTDVIEGQVEGSTQSCAISTLANACLSHTHSTLRLALTLGSCTRSTPRLQRPDPIDCHKGPAHPNRPTPGIALAAAETSTHFDGDKTSSDGYRSGSPGVEVETPSSDADAGVAGSGECVISSTSSSHNGDVVPTQSSSHRCLRGNRSESHP